MQTVMVGACSWAALEITSSEPGLPPRNNGSIVDRVTPISVDEAELATRTNESILAVNIFVMICENDTRYVKRSHDVIRFYLIC